MKNLLTGVMAASLLALLLYSFSQTRVGAYLGIRDAPGILDTLVVPALIVFAIVGGAMWWYSWRGKND